MLDVEKIDGAMMFRASGNGRLQKRIFLVAALREIARQQDIAAGPFGSFSDTRGKLELWADEIERHK